MDEQSDHRDDEDDYDKYDPESFGKFGVEYHLVGGFWVIGLGDEVMPG